MIARAAIILTQTRTSPLALSLCGAETRHTYDAARRGAATERAARRSHGTHERRRTHGAIESSPRGSRRPWRESESDGPRETHHRSHLGQQGGHDDALALGGARAQRVNEYLWSDSNGRQLAARFATAVARERE